MRNVVLDLLVFFLLTGLVGCRTIGIETLTATTNNTNTESIVQPVFRSILPELQQKTEIPILLPEYIPETDNPLLVGLIEKSSSFEYRVMLAFSEICNGGTACRLGSVSGVLLQSDKQTLEGTEVTLANNITAYFADATCGANCSDSTLAWIDGNVIYQVAIGAGKLETLLDMANSMMEVSDRD